MTSSEKVSSLNMITVIMVNVLNGVGGHGDFLTSLALSWQKADFSNKLILCGAYLKIIYKYELNEPKYLRNS